jgi:hypothetical protein
MEIFDEKRFLADIERELSTPPDRTASPLSRSPPTHEMIKLGVHSKITKREGNIAFEARKLIFSVLPRSVFAFSRR